MHLSLHHLLRVVYRPLLAAFLALCAVPASCQTKEAPYKADDRLAAPVTLSLRDASFADVTRAISDATKVEVSAGTAVADDKASLFVRDRPARNVMADIANHFGCRWRAAGKGYVLEITSDQSTLEATLRSRLRERAIAALDARMRALQQLQGYTDEQIDARLNELKGALGQAELSKRDRANLAEEQQTLRDFRAPGGRVVATVFSALTVAQRAQLAAGKQVRIDELPANLVPEVQKAAGSSGGNRSMRTMSVSVSGTGDKAPPVPPIDADDKSPATGASAALRIHALDEAGMGRAPQSGASPLGLQLAVTLTCKQGTGGVTRMTSSQWSTRATPQGIEPKDHTRDSSDPDLSREIEIRLASAPRTAGEPLSQPARPSLGALVEQIHTATGLNIMTDSFVRARIRPDLASGKRTVLALLNAVCDDLDYAWEKDASGIRLRSNQFFEDRPSEVPGRLLKPLRDRAEAGETVGLDDYAGLAASLTDAQIRGLDGYWDTYFAGSTTPKLGGGGRMYPVRQDLRFWAMLGPVQRKQLLDGDVLPVSRMTRGQAEAFVTALTVHDDFMGGMNELKGEPTRAEVASGAFTLKAGVAHQFAATSPSPDGSTSKAVAMMMIDTGPRNGKSPAPSLKDMKPRIVGPDGNEISLDQMQQQTLNSFMFSYLLSGNPQPARTTAVMIPQNGKQKGAPE